MQKTPLPKNEILLIISELRTKKHETTRNKPEKPEMTNKLNINPKTAAPLNPYMGNSKILIPTKNNMPKTTPPENEIILIINTLRTKTHETTGNKPENQLRLLLLPEFNYPATQQLGTTLRLYTKQ